MISGRPLEGIRIADFTTRGPGPYATQLMHRLGAEITKIEPPTGDPARAMPALFEALNAGKNSIRCDLRTPAGRAAALEAIAASDAVVDSWRFADAARFGLDRDSLISRFPRLVHCSMSGFGSAGDLADRAGQDLTYLAASGLLTALYGEEPRVPGAPLGDVMAGAMAALRVCAALLHTAVTGEGSGFEVSVAATLAESAELGRLARGTPLGSGTEAPGKAVFSAKGGRRFALAVIEPDSWSKLYHVLGLEGGDVGADSATERVRISEVFRGLEASDVEQRLTSGGLPWAWVVDAGEHAFMGGLPSLAEPDLRN